MKLKVSEFIVRVDHPAQMTPEHVAKVLYSAIGKSIILGSVKDASVLGGLDVTERRPSRTSPLRGKRK